MDIRELAPADHQKYNELVGLYGSVFNTLQWIKLFGKDIRNYGIYDKGDELIGGFFIYTGKKYGVPIYCNPPLTPSVGPFLKIESTNPVKVLDKYKQVISLISEFMDKMNCPVISISFDKSIIDMQPFIWRDFKVIPHYTYVVGLVKSVEDIWKRMSTDRRNNITKGTKDGLVVEKTSDHAIIRSLVLKTFSRQKMAIDDTFINKVLFDFANDSNSLAFVASSDGDPIACEFCVRDNKTAYGLLAGYDSENKHRGAGALCIWEAIKYSKQLGLTHFDFSGSMVPDIELYLRGFGGELRPYYRANKAILPLEIALKFFKRRLF